MTIMNRYIAFILLLVLCATGCTRDDNPAAVAAEDGNSIKYVLNDNFSFGVLYAAMNDATLLDTLVKPGPYTLFAPDNTAFNLLGITYPVSTYAFQNIEAKMNEMMRYAVLRGHIAVSDIPMDAVQAFKTIGGGNIYVKKYLDGTDTIVTINGFKLVSKDNAASNGLIHVVPQVLNAELYTTTISQLRNDTSTTLFAAALQRAGLAELLSGSEAYSVLAPSNAAMQQSSFADVDLRSLAGILQSDPVKLAALLQYHIAKGRWFQGDLFRYAKSNPDGIDMQNGGKVKIGGTDSYRAITFLGNGNGNQAAGIYIPTPSYANMNYTNIPCGNGTIHLINRVLIP